jgi:hypothetical protein
MTEKVKRKLSKKWKIILIILLVILSVAGWWIWQEGRPWYYSLQAYVYGFPLVVMDVTREVSTAVTEPGELTAPVNQFAVMTKYPDASFRLIPRTGLDTQFAVAWADLENEPLVLSVPNTNGRYYVIALFDMWSNVFASIGSRTTGTDSASFLIVGPKWKGTLTSDFKQVYKSPTRYIWVNAQMQSNGEQDYDVVNSLQKQYKLTPLSMWGQPYTPSTEILVDSNIDTNTPPLDQVKNMDANTFFSRLAKLMKDNPPSPGDASMLETLEFLGIIPGEEFDISKVDGNIRRGLERGMGALGLLESGVKDLDTENGWIIIPENFANYGTDYETRAGIALIGLGGILPQDILYPTAFNDTEDKPLDAANRYVLHFEKNQFPPCKVTWSVAMYDPDGFYVPNEINRYHLAPWMPLKYNDDGSLDIFLQAVSPGADKESNWLPAPSGGLFNLTTRIFWPEDAALDGSWKMPGIKKLN